MISAGAFTILLEHPASPVRNAIPDAFVRRMLVGLAMGATAVAIVFSTFGKRSGAHFNPAVTLAFWRLGKVRGLDALFYVIAQFVGGIAGVALVALFMREALVDPAVNFVATVPGPRGIAVAFLAELVISFVLMSVVLLVSNMPGLARYTGIFAGVLVATFITFEAPLSGMSMNPARTFGSAFVGHLWIALWIYFTAPVIAMQLAASVYVRGDRVVHCAKLHHHNQQRCIFNCRFAELRVREGAPARSGDLQVGVSN
ncbi:MAG TPA: aquaporin [Chthoniobacterales bacterium]|nr:aquaporin [Chthoniobacterales bacterium]